MSEKNSKVYMTLVGSNMHIHKAMDAINKASGITFAIKAEEKQFFKEAPSLFWRMAESGYNLKVTGNLYLLHNFLCNANGFDGICVHEGTEYLINMDDEFDAETCTSRLIELALEWGWSTPRQILAPSTPPSTAPLLLPQPHQARVHLAAGKLRSNIMSLQAHLRHAHLTHSHAH